MEVWKSCTLFRVVADTALQTFNKPTVCTSEHLIGRFFIKMLLSKVHKVRSYLIKNTAYQQVAPMIVCTLVCYVR